MPHKVARSLAHFRGETIHREDLGLRDSQAVLILVRAGKHLHCPSLGSGVVFPGAAIGRALIRTG